VRCLGDDMQVASGADSVARELSGRDVERSVVDAAVGVAAGRCCSRHWEIVEPAAARWLLRGRLVVEWS
jgi:hypothetical protein